MKLQEYLSDDAVLQEIGIRIARLRIEHELTQEQLADKSGVSKPTVERLERGQPVQSITLIRIFRSLGLLSALDSLLIDETIRPMETLLKKGKQRQRVRKSTTQKKSPTPSTFRWGDEQ
ncbi:MAG: helix-turn-helix transcriptional regulator [Sphaerochaeta sp.]|nr:helix-turn-helix transcriptional regulator [Sphaerochaeta sp.]